jgi:hypothetical protein
MLRVAAERPATALSDDQLLIAMVWLIQEAGRALDARSMGLPFAGTQFTADQVEFIKSIWFDAHLVGVFEMTQEFFRRQPELLVTAADWRRSLRGDLPD